MAKELVIPTAQAGGRCPGRQEVAIMRQWSERGGDLADQLVEVDGLVSEWRVVLTRAAQADGATCFGRSVPKHRLAIDQRGRDLERLHGLDHPGIALGPVVARRV